MLSKHWKIPTMTSSFAHNSMTSWELINQPAIVSPATINTTAVHPANARPSNQPDRTIGRNRACAPEPAASPIRTVSAIDSPSGTMNEVPAQVIATWCAASGMAPNRPIKIPAAENAPTSASICKLAGKPTRNSARTSAPTGRRNQRIGTHSVRSEAVLSHHSIATRMATRENKVAHAAPSMPIAGKPRSPKMRMALRPTLRTTPPRKIQNGTHGRLSASAWFFNATEPSAGINENITTTKYVRESRATAGAWPNHSRWSAIGSEASAKTVPSAIPR